MYYLISEEIIEKLECPRTGVKCTGLTNDNCGCAIFSKAQEINIQDAFDDYIQLNMLLGDEFLERAKSLGKDYQDFEGFLKGGKK